MHKIFSLAFSFTHSHTPSLFQIDIIFPLKPICLFNSHQIFDISYFSIDHQ